ncbi:MULTISPECIES: PadR family transcriptional regulator [unclassified Clostridioides]|uniref:PadR family transcriptional regulator n=1 Tax=unclassified Clostridioides TaxID=2635829 RepID=UPI001D100DB0|nr:PadR family transcriptional regulator [Clostridioides sp. ZZV14-6150]MCC0719157.1 PadR family transcriptional regulator [Clostridioides sp. ZZV14-6105]MCC0724686.1 PadR family transcriptional regulator [Clostridioides sp. ZZV14-6104]MCC0744619.1 PadR family transcriptional regulator [Clostridioides sp. ZZV14-6044]MCC0750579.1 PadR family transcriptional regulator [Clostridioides sp. ZZV13-5731]
MDLNKEVLKGHIDTLILSILNKGDSYGYEIAKVVRDETTFELKESTLYVSLKRLESKGLIKSYWGNDQGAGSRRKYYNITDDGKDNLEIKIQEWDFIQGIMNKFLKKGD